MLSQQNRRRSFVVIALTGSALGLTGVALATAPDVPSLELNCPSDRVAVAQFTYTTSTDLVAGTDTAAEAANDVIDSPMIEGTANAADTEVVVDEVDESIVTVTDEEGEDLTAVIELEGSDAQGWRPSTVARCQ